MSDVYEYDKGTDTLLIDDTASRPFRQEVRHLQSSYLTAKRHCRCGECFCCKIKRSLDAAGAVPEGWLCDD